MCYHRNRFADRPIGRRTEKNSKYAMISHLAKKSDQEIVFGRLGFLKGYLFKEVHTYTTDEFEKKELNQWEVEQEISSLK